MLGIPVDARAARRLVLIALALAVMVPSLAAAQSIAGVVRDASGAVLPGVTVEAASPALIEKVRTAVSDGAGQYRIENLTPGTYKITYSLPGFSTVERAGVEVTTGVSLTLNADLRVGGVQESITVTGETPVVDVQNSARSQRVLSDEVLAALPASRGYGNLLTAVSGIQSNGTQNGGVNPGMIFFTSRGGRSNESGDAARRSRVAARRARANARVGTVVAESRMGRDGSSRCLEPHHAGQDRRGNARGADGPRLRDRPGLRARHADGQHARLRAAARAGDRAHGLEPRAL